MRRLAPLLLVLAFLVVALAQDMDLPVDVPEFRPITVRPTPTPALRPPPDEKDPRDEPPPVFFGEEIDPEGDKIVYVIDVSCSMDELSRPVAWGIGPDGQTVPLDPGPLPPTKLELAKAELIRSISGLARTFRFDVVAYSCTVTVWQPVLQEATAGAKASAVAWVQGLTSRDATGTGPATALGLGLDRGNQSVVLLTDGAPNCGASGVEGHRTMIRNANAQRATINVFGILAYGEWRAFCQSVAADSGGAYFDVP